MLWLATTISFFYFYISFTFRAYKVILFQQIGEATGGGCGGGAEPAAFIKDPWLPAHGCKFCKALKAVLFCGWGALDGW